MSYLGLPRLHFIGRFQADPPTINNNPKNYDNDGFEPRFQREEPPAGPLSSWNPRGSGAFRLDKCVITGVIGQGADAVATTEWADPLIGGRLADDNARVSAKIVDLDPYQQASSEIYGLRLRLFDSAGLPVLSGNFETASFFDFWMRFPQAASPLYGAASYQSIIDDVEFHQTESPIAAQLEAGSSGGKLSIKFNIDGYDADSSSPNFTWGRIAGTIGSYLEGEPRHLVAGRRLRKQVGGPLQHGVCRLDAPDKKLHVDLGNSIPTASVGGSLQVPGPLQVVLLPDREAPIPLATLDDFDDDFYRAQAGVVSLPLTDSEVQRAAGTRIGISVPGQGVLLAENVEGTWLQADRSVFRIYPPESTPQHANAQVAQETAQTTLYATRFGEPAEDVDISVWHLEKPAPPASPSVVETEPGTEPAPAPPAQDPVLSFDPCLRTDRHGVATLRLAARDPGNPRPHLDGQVYTVSYGWGQASAGEEGQLSVLVWSHHPVPDKIDWITDVQPLLQRYANLYPVMHDILDLSNYHDVVRYRVGLELSMSEPLESPSLMPVSRDLSPGKRDTIIKWLKTEPTPSVLEIRDRDDLLRLLQMALQVEHATVPAYLASLFTIKPDRNPEVRRIILSVVMQEMLHMALVANIINAIGGRPRVDRPGFVPQYPSHLPGGVLPDLVVSLRKCSISHVRGVFMAIEQPDAPLNTESLELISRIRPERVSLTQAGDFDRYDDDDDDTEVDQGARYDDLSERIGKFFAVAEYEKFTIGWLYQQIACALSDLEEKEQQAGKTLFVGDPSRQSVWPNAPGHLFRVIDLRSAQWSILEIIHQGEGSPGDPTTGRREELAHYYRFQEIVEGRQLVQKDGKWVFEGPVVPFDPDGVYPMVDDPDSYALPPDSRVREASLLCDRVYGDLLTALNRVFDGHPDALHAAVSLMFSLEVQVKRLLSMPITPGSDTVAGPSFQVGR